MPSTSRATSSFLRNVVRIDTKGTSEAVNAKFELMERGSYIPTGYKFDPVVLDANLPLEFLPSKRETRCASRNPKAPNDMPVTVINTPPD